ncbi:MAG: hypothetical protein K5657_06500 [Desulfovibrio sp.]|nr:hypothetical protein [Desulfovibrio sp.]
MTETLSCLGSVPLPHSGGYSHNVAGLEVLVRTFSSPDTPAFAVDADEYLAAAPLRMMDIAVYFAARLEGDVVDSYTPFCIVQGLQIALSAEVAYVRRVGSPGPKKAPCVFYALLSS